MKGPKALRGSQILEPLFQSTFWSQVQNTESESLAPKDLKHPGQTNSLRENLKAQGV